MYLLLIGYPAASFESILSQNADMLSSHLPIPNRVLASLPRLEYLRLLLHLEVVELVEGEVLCESGKPLQYVYFPSDCLVSLLTLVDENDVFAVALVCSFI